MQVRGADCALFPVGAVSYYNIKATFMPTPAQAAEAEKALATAQLATVDPHAKSWYKKEPNPAYTAISNHLPLFRQQFYGFYNAQKQPCLFINAFPLDKNFTIGQRWLRETVWVFDGGTSFWQAKYNLATHRFEYFSYNRMG
jgi:hypothetical protein